MKGPRICSSRLSLNLWKANISSHIRHWQGVLLLAIGCSPSLAISLPIYHRSDLSPKIAPIVCASSEGQDIQKMLWQNEIYDTMFASKVFQVKGSKLTAKLLQREAIKFAKKNEHLGAAYGTCEQKNIGWVASIPSSFPQIKWQESILKVNYLSLRKICRSISVHFTGLAGGNSRLIWSSRKWKVSKNPDINTKFLAEGNLSITCKPIEKNKGPELFALVPLHGMEREVPFVHELTADWQTLHDWINKIRGLHNLPALETGGKPLKLSSQRMIGNGSIRHDRTLIRKEKKRLGEQSIEFLGENRVLGSSPEAMAWLLWNSPRHRALLLNPRATHLSLSLKTLPRSSLAVIILAKSNQL